MTEKATAQLKYLIAQYVGRRITNEELSSLKDIVNMSGNDELDGFLRHLWMSGQYPSYAPDEQRKTRMIQHIEQTTRKTSATPLRKRFARNLSRIAAVFILVLLGGTCIYLYRSNQNLAVYKGNETILNVGAGQEAEFILPDGSSVKLNSGSTLRYSNDFGASKRHVNFSGEAFFNVKQDKTRPFVVSAQHIEIEVVGTTFNLYAFDDGDLAEMTLLTGSVRASSKKNPQYKVSVNPSEKVICDASTGKLTVLKTDTLYETAWLNGEIVFKSEKLSDVLTRLERKYGVHFRYEANPELLNDRFSGRIGKDNNIGDVMKILTLHYPLKYGHAGNTLTLSDR